MVKQNLLVTKIEKLNLSNFALIEEISKIINDKYSREVADLAQKSLQGTNVDSWRKGKAIPSNPIIRDTLAILLEAPNGNFFNLVLNSEDANQILISTLDKYNKAIISDDLHEFKLKAFNGDFDRIRRNPYSSKVTIMDLMGCIAYLKISGYLLGRNLGLIKNKKLNLNLYKQIMDLPRLAALVDPNQLLQFLQKNIEKKGRINSITLQKSALLYLLLIITGDSFFN